MSDWDIQTVDFAIHSLLRWNLRIEDVDLNQSVGPDGQLCYGTVRVALGISFGLAKALKALNRKGHVHGLRYFGAQLAWESGSRLEAIAVMLGHSNTGQTMRYIGIGEQSAHEVAQRMQHFTLARREKPAAAAPDQLEP